MTLKPLLTAGALSIAVLAPQAAGQKRELLQLQREVSLLQETLRVRDQAMVERLVGLEALLSQTSDKLDRLSAGQAVIEHNLSTLDGRLSAPTMATSAKLDALATQVSGLRAVIEEILPAIDRLSGDARDIKTHLSQLPPPSGDLTGDGSETAINASEAIFEGGLQDYMRGNIENARGQFMDYLALYPNNQRAGEAQYYLAETYYSAAEYDEAVRQFDQVYKRYPLSPMAPDALYKQGMAYMKLRKRDAAQQAFEDVIKRFPDKPVAQHARAELNGLLNAKPTPGL